MEKEKRLIDANYLVNKGIRNCPIEDGGIPLKDFHQHQRILAFYPTVDAVEVVRCKDCKHRIYSDFDGCYVCHHGGFNAINQNHFCSYGERKDNG